MCSFFAFCISSDWTGRNPMNGLKKPKAPDMAPTNYFTRTDFKCIVNATYPYEYGGQRLSLSRGQAPSPIFSCQGRGCDTISRTWSSETAPPTMCVSFVAQ